MKQPLVLASLLVLLAGCATQSQATLRRGRIIKPDAPAASPVVAKPVAKPAPAAAKPAPAVAVAPVAKPAAPAPAPVVTPPPAAPAAPAAPVIAVAPPAAPASTPAVTPAAAPLVARRNGSVVEVSWTLPASDVGYKAIEIMRNEREEAPGRARVRAVRSSVTSLQDTVPDTQANYWYWIKLTGTDGQIQNIGPVAAPVQN